MSIKRRWTRSLALLAPMLLVACGPSGSESQPDATAAGTDGASPHQSVSRESLSFEDAQRSLGELVDPGATTDLKVIADRFEATLNALKAASQQSPRDTFDASAVVSEVGRNPESLFAWVRDNTGLVPYKGVLRGPRGVLLDRFGNSLDRSLLLIQLLELAGHDARLARTTLAPDQIRLALKEVASTPARKPLTDAVVESDEQSRTRIDALAASLDVDGDELRGRLDDVRVAADRAAADAAQRSKSQSEQLLKILAGALEPVATVEQGERTDALSDHWWVQLAQAGRWIDLDPVLLKAGPGDSSVSATSTFDTTDLPDSLRHLVRIRIVVERAAGGRLEEQTVFEHALRLSDTTGLAITLAQVPSQIPPDSRMQVDSSSAQVWLDEQQEWIPVLVIGRDHHFQSSFALTGDVQRPGSLPSLAPAGGFSDALGGGEAEPAKSELTAEFIDYEFLSPGSSSRVERRTLVDVIGPAARQSGKIPVLGNRPAITGLDLLLQTEILPLVAQFSPEFVAHLLAESLLSAGGDLLNLLRNEQIDSTAQTGKRGSDPAIVPSELYDLALARHGWSHVAQSVVISSPNLLTRHVSLREDPNGLVQQSVFDIVANDVDVLDGDYQHWKAVRIAQGVVDTNVETLLVPRHAGSGNISDLMSAEAAADVHWTVLKGTAIDGGLADSVSPNTLVRIRNDLSRGFLAVVPSGLSRDEASKAGWWRVDPVNGTVLGIDSLGRGGSPTGEKTILDTNALQTVRVTTEFYQFFTCAVGTGALAVSVSQKTGSAAAGAGAALPLIALCAAATRFKVLGHEGPGSSLLRGHQSLFGTLIGLTAWSYGFTMGAWSKFK